MDWCFVRKQDQIALGLSVKLITTCGRIEFVNLLKRKGKRHFSINSTGLEEK